MSRKITELYAWVITQPSGEDAIPVGWHDGILVPMIGASIERMNGFRETAIKVAKNNPLRLLKFSTIETLEYYNFPKDKKN